MVKIMQDIYKVHFSDDMGTATIGCKTEEQYNEVIKNLKEDPTVNDIWVERWYEEEGWQA